MDANRFDRFTRAFAGALSRRTALIFASGGIMSSLLSLSDAEAKKRKKGKKGKKGKGKGKNKNKKPCTISKDAVALTTESKFNKKPLRLRQSADFDNGGRQTEVTLDGKAVLKVTYEIAAPGLVTTVTYGGAFQGIDQARFTNDGVTITGEIDGRAIVPLPVGTDPSQMAFADGGPPLDVQADEKLGQAIESLFSKAAQQSNSCRPAQQRSAERKRSASARDHSSSFDCITKQAKCGLDAVKCEYEAYEITAGCAGVGAWIGALVCGVIFTIDCAYEGAKCARSAKYSSTCCPARCGGDVGDLLGADPLCCEEACLDPNSNQSGGCCRAGESGCGGECCPSGKCTNGFCCAPPNGAVCGNQCCGPFDSCCGGTTCCTGICNGNVCCSGNQLPCGGGCCNGTCLNGNCCPSGQVVCNGACCPSGHACQNNQCVQVCSIGQEPCGSICCTLPQTCQVCPNGARICSTGACVN